MRGFDVLAFLVLPRVWSLACGGEEFTALPRTGRRWAGAGGSATAGVGGSAAARGMRVADHGRGGIACGASAARRVAASMRRERVISVELRRLRKPRPIVSGDAVRRYRSGRVPRVRRQSARGDRLLESPAGNCCKSERLRGDGSRGANASSGPSPPDVRGPGADSDATSAPVRSVPRPQRTAQDRTRSVRTRRRFRSQSGRAA